MPSVRNHDRASPVGTVDEARDRVPHATIKMLKPLTAVGLAVALVVLTPSYSAAAGPPSSYVRCAGTPANGAVTLTAHIRWRRPTLTQYYARIVPAFPFGWSGTATVGGYEHPRVAIPVGTYHWFASPAIFPSRRLVHLSVETSPNPGVFNNYAVEIWAPRRCRPG